MSIYSYSAAVCYSEAMLEFIWKRLKKKTPNNTVYSIDYI